MLVLDSLSTDATTQIASTAGAAIIQREWRGYIDARTFALSHVQTPWTLMIDADEALDPILRDAIVAADKRADGYRVARMTYFCGRPMRIWSDERILRLFRTDHATLRSRAMSDNAQVHEVWSVKGKVVDLPGTLLHYSYPTVAAYRAKYDRYTSLEAGALRASSTKLQIEETKAWLRFLQLLLRRGAVLDGWRGAYAAWWSAWYPAVALKKSLLRQAQHDK
ncbi:MAG: glycosyltransferase family 2 protein [Candidatus Eremiobacteraeota bacterium]|nr:glycosyltransferase family 2 protein [Candidatus Eremiobacteraeota bacterium]